jgi:hypothetical protein
MLADLYDAWVSLSGAVRWFIKIGLSGGLLASIVFAIWQARHAEVRAQLWYGYVLLGLLIYSVVIVWIGFRSGKRRERRLFETEVVPHLDATLDDVVKKLLLAEQFVDHVHEALRDPTGAVSILQSMRGLMFGVIAQSGRDQDVRIAYLSKEKELLGDGHLRVRDIGYVHRHGAGVRKKKFDLDEETIEGEAFVRQTFVYVPDVALESRARPLEAGEAMLSLMCAPAMGLGVGQAAEAVGVLRVSSTRELADSDRIVIKLAAAALGAAEDYLARVR